MANELNVGIGVTGLTVTAQLYTAGAASGGAISCPEISTSGTYTGTMAGAAGTYQVAFLAGGVLRGYGNIIWDGSAEVTANTANVTKVNGTAQTAGDLAANQTTILARLGAWTGTGINTILGAFRAIAAKAAALTPTDLSASTTFDNTTDSAEAIRDNMGTAQSGDTYALANGASGFVAIKGDTADIGVAGAGLSAIPIVPANVKQVNDLPVDGSGTDANPWGPV